MSPLTRRALTIAGERGIFRYVLSSLFSRWEEAFVFKGDNHVSVMRFAGIRAVVHAALAATLVCMVSCAKLAPPQPFDTLVDTTSHDFSWQITSFGDANAGSSTLKDVFILNDTLAFAVGDIRKLDSLGNIETETYNFARWNGATWTILHARTNFRGNVVTAPMDGVIAFSDHDIWLVGTDPIHGDGVNWNDVDIRQILSDDSMTVSHAWAANSSDIYFAGGLGTVLHYISGSWMKVNTGTRLPFQDIWGSSDPTTGQYEVLCLASNRFEFPQREMLLRVAGTGSQLLSDSGLTLNLNPA